MNRTTNFRSEAMHTETIPTASGNHPQTEQITPEPLVAVNPMPVPRSNVGRESDAVGVFDHGDDCSCFDCRHKRGEWCPCHVCGDRRFRRAPEQMLDLGYEPGVMGTWFREPEKVPQ